MSILLCAIIYMLIYSIMRRNPRLIIGSAIATLYFVLSIVSDVPDLLAYVLPLTVAKNVVLLIFIIFMAKVILQDWRKTDE